VTEALLLSYEKEAKDFFKSGPGAFKTPDSRVTKVFAPLFLNSGGLLYCKNPQRSVAGSASAHFQLPSCCWHAVVI
jgi:hypothetical protein